MTRYDSAMPKQETPEIPVPQGEKQKPHWRRTIKVEDHTRPLGNNKHELMAQEMALGKTRPKAYEAAGYKSKTPGPHAYTLCSKYPAIERRAQFLKEKMFEIRVTDKVISNDEIMHALVENVREARRGKPVYDKNGEVKGFTPDFAAVNTGLKILADINGMIVRKSETKHGKSDPLDDASEAQLLYMIERAGTELGVEVDVDGLKRAIGLEGFAEALGGANGGSEEEQAPRLEAVSETEGVS